MKMKLAALAVALSSASAFATDCGCTKTPTAYDKTQDVKIGALQDRDAQLAADIHQVHVNTLGKYSESWGLEDRANIGKLQNEKLDKAVFQVDQQRQDAAAAEYAAGQAVRDGGQDDHINAVQGAAQSANEKADDLAARADVTEGAIRETNAQLVTTDKRSINNALRLDSAEAVNTRQDKVITSNTQRITTSESDIQQLYSNGEYAQSRIDAANANIEANRAAQVASNKRIAANTRQLADHEQRLGNLEQNTNRQFADMKGRIDRVEKRANAGASAALSAASIPQVTEYQRFAVGAGVGGYEGESALAVGFSSRVSSAVVVKASVTTDSQHGFGYGAGLSVGF